MNIQLLSDLHLEFDDEDGHVGDIDTALDLTDVDVLVLAGDIHQGTQSLDRIKRWAERCIVLMICGNHEFYKQELFETLEKFRRTRIKNFHFLENNRVDIEGVRFLGCTLWTDLNKSDPLTMIAVQQGLNDYHVIKIGNKKLKLKPIDTIGLHNMSRKFLEQELATAHQPTVVITHHLPTVAVQDPMWRDNRLSPGYYSTDCNHLIGEADYWLFGHQHSSTTIKIGNTILTSNPRGYLHEPNPHFSLTTRILIP